MKMNKELSHSA